jgi:xanthine dehydrogenase molybdopterin-binding subunit B
LAWDSRFGRKEDVRLVSGKGRYLDDIQIENTAYAYFVRSPHAHAILGAVDTTDARAGAWWFLASLGRTIFRTQGMCRCAGRV